MTAPVDTPIFYETVAYFNANPPTTATRNTIVADAINRAPRPGQKPITRKRRKK